MSTNAKIFKPTGAVSAPRLLLHLEGSALLAAALILYGYQDFSWTAFALLLLLPDLPLFLYSLNPQIARAAYNLAHTIIFPLGLALLSAYNGSSLGLQAALIWLAHIGMDRTFGYGFKYASSPKETHFSRL